MTPSKVKPLPDKRGKHTPKYALDNSTQALIDEHIDSFNPSAGHYRRAHAPLQLYLPPELTIKYIYDLFKELRKTNSKEKYKLLQTR